MNSPLHRRRFLGTSLLGSACLLVLRDSRSAWSYQANQKLNLAIIGTSGQGDSNTAALAGENIVALCDVDERRGDEAQKKQPKAKRFSDFRKMLEALQREIDAVVVSTPDHTHAVAALTAMRLGKHVFCEKPLTRTVYEARLMRETALKHKVVTQMGNQGSATEALRRAVELAWAGVIGQPTDVHIWLAGGNGPQDRPKDQPAVPGGLHWDLWLGPAPYRPYHPAYVPGSWRSWRAFGTGASGDMGCHTANMAFRALRLDLLWNADPTAKPAPRSPIRVQAEASEIHPESYPRRLLARYEFPARGNLPPVKLTWYSGGLKPPREVLRGHPMTDWGCLVGGSKGAVFSSCPWNTRFLLLPKEQFAQFQGPAPSLPRTNGRHSEWVQACKGGPKTFSSFEIGGPMTEMILLGTVASLAGQPIEYDPLTGKIINLAEANPLLHREYRAGWSC